MLLLNPAFILFVVSILISIFIVISSPSLLFVWLGLELNTLSFIPLIMSSKNAVSGEASIKYFLTQTLASVVFIFGCIFMCLTNNLLLSTFFVCVALFIKLGAAPFHSWFPSVSNLLTWDAFYILLTVQKINPLLVMVLFFTPFSFLNLVVLLSSLLLGSLMGVIQVNTRLLLTYSSINQVGWLLIALYTFPSFVSWFFLLYMVLLAAILLTLYLNNIQHINQFSSFPLNSFVQFYLVITLLSMGGMPPFLGFFGKWMILMSVINSCLYILSLVMILTSLFVLFFYLRMMISSFLLSSNKWSVLEYNSNSSLFLSVMVLISLGGLPLSLYI